MDGTEILMCIWVKAIRFLYAKFQFELMYFAMTKHRFLSNGGYCKESNYQLMYCYIWGKATLITDFSHW